MKKLLLTLLVPTLLFGFSSQEQAKKQMVNDLEFFRTTFNSQYAPLEWKGTFANWDIDQQISQAQQQVMSHSSITVKDYQRILKNFFASMGDYHVNISFLSTESAYLPIHFKEAEGKFYVTKVEAHLIKDRNAKSIAVGDEILSIDGKLAKVAIQEYLNQEYEGGLTLTDRTDGVLYFPLRIGALGHQVPKGFMLFGIRQQLTKQLKEIKVDWLYNPEEIANIIPPAGAKSAFKPKLQAAKEESGLAFLRGSMMDPRYKALKKARYTLGNESIGSREGFLPALGAKTWESDTDSCPFHAYTFMLPTGEKIGYVRIPHYDAGANEVEQFKKIIAMYESSTDALIVDQLNNPGGSVFYMYALASLLTDKPLQVPLHRIALTQKEIMEAVEELDVILSINSDFQAQSVIGKSLDGYPVNLDLAKGFKKFLQFEISEWNQGHLLTAPTPLFGLAAIKPYPVTHYSKPILFLINELDFSCGDFLPAILQDNKRAVLMGTRTGGAGGFILSASHPNLFGVDSFTYTGSLAERVDHNPIENLGVHPDVVYEITTGDLQNRYAEFSQAITEQIKKMLP